MILNDAAENTALSWAARGLLWYLLTKPDGWEVRTSHLIAQSDSEGKKRLNAIIRELETLGYVIRWSERGDRGRIEWHSEIFECLEDSQAWLEENSQRVLNSFRLSKGTSTMLPQGGDGEKTANGHPRNPVSDNSTTPPLRMGGLTTHGQTDSVKGGVLVITDSAMTDSVKTEEENKKPPLFPPHGGGGRERGKNFQTAKQPAQPDAMADAATNPNPEKNINNGQDQNSARRSKSKIERAVRRQYPDKPPPWRTGYGSGEYQDGYVDFVWAQMRKHGERTRSDAIERIENAELEGKSVLAEHFRAWQEQTCTHPAQPLPLSLGDVIAGIEVALRQLKWSKAQAIAYMVEHHNWKLTPEVKQTNNFDYLNNQEILEMQAKITQLLDERKRYAV
jgi:hypothetical protein